MIKGVAGLMVVLGAACWLNGAMVTVAQADDYWEQAAEQQRRQQEEWTRQQNDEMARQQNEAIQRQQEQQQQDYARQIEDSYRQQKQRQQEYSLQNDVHGRRPNNAQPSSYGAVAWGAATEALGSAAKQESEKAAKDLALQRCGQADCKIAMQYSNQCVGLSYGANSKKDGIYFWKVDVDVDGEKAGNKAKLACKKEKMADNCKVFMYECSLPGQTGGDADSNWKAHKATPFKASSYGAVAWGNTTSVYGSASGEKSLEGAVELAFQKCGTDDCVLAKTYGDSCAVLSKGIKADGTDHFQTSVRPTQKQAEVEGLAGCAQQAKDCKIVLSECALPNNAKQASVTPQSVPSGKKKP